MQQQKNTPPHSADCRQWPAGWPALVRFQPSQCHAALDERRVKADDPGLKALTRAVAAPEQSRTTADLARVAEPLTDMLAMHRPELKAGAPC